MLLLPLAAIAAAVLTAVTAAPADPGTVVGSPELQAARGRAAMGAAALDNPWDTPSSTPETSIIAAAAPTAAAQDEYMAVWSIHEGGGCNDTAFSEITINTCVCEQTFCVVWTREAPWRPKQEHAAWLVKRLTD